MFFFFVFLDWKVKEHCKNKNLTVGMSYWIRINGMNLPVNALRASLEINSHLTDAFKVRRRMAAVGGPGIARSQR